MIERIGIVIAKEMLRLSEPAFLKTLRELKELWS
jgi:hypothetical protein